MLQLPLNGMGDYKAAWEAANHETQLPLPRPLVRCTVLDS
ncbi:MAG: hypothetical protein QOE55_1115 [Acidobacteriaceae bacterium]|jgi:hypothetical protein|nr:hypothetical protein [Acidobacteriaceae bacterium]MEA3007167.1 hypothetical protein [Acidobacteriaceae bacterium]